MKNIQTKTGLLLMLFLVAFKNINAQFYQVAEKFSYQSANRCLCNPFNPETEIPAYDFNGHVSIYFDKDLAKQLWGNLTGRSPEVEFGKRMHHEFESELEKILGKNFDNFYDAMDNFFQEYANDPPLRNSFSSFNKSLDDLADSFNFEAEQLLVLDQRELEIRQGNLNSSYLENYYFGNLRTLDIKTIDQIKELREKALSNYNAINNAINPGGKTNLYEGSRVIKREGLAPIVKDIGREYSKNYDRTLWQKSTYQAANVLRDFIMAYRSGRFIKNINCLQSPNSSICKDEIEFYKKLLDKGNIYRVDDNKFLKGRAWLRGIRFSPHKPTPRSLESIRKSTAITNLGENITTYLDNNFDVKKAVNKYFEHYDYNKASQDCVNYLFQKVLGDGDFAPDTNDYKSNRTPTCRAVGTPNTALDMEWKPSSIELGYQGFQNIMAELNNIPENHGKIGHVIKDILSANGKGLPDWMDDILVGRYFNFSVVPVNADGAQIEFRDGFGTEAWNDGLTTNDGIYEHIRRVDFIGTKLELNNLQIDILLDASGFVKELFDFLNAFPNNSDANEFAIDEIQVFNEGGIPSLDDFRESSKLQGITRADAERLQDDICKVLADSKFEKFKRLLRRGKRNNKKSFDKIPVDSLNMAIMNLTGDDLCFAKIVANTINSDKPNTITYFNQNEILSTKDNPGSSTTKKAFVDIMIEKYRNALYTGNGVDTNTFLGGGRGGGATVVYNGGTHSIVGTYISNYDQVVTPLHEVFGHGRPISLGRLSSQDEDAIRFENMVWRILKMPLKQRDGSDHGSRTTPLPNPQNKPNYDN